MSANFSQTNRNANRYFFATSEGGEQTLGLQFGTTGGTPNLSTMAVTISGAGGNGVIVNQAPSFQATDYIFAEEGMGVYGSTYFTPSTLSSNITGINLSSDRVPGSGTACIESYSGNGSFLGFEFLSRGVGGALVSTINVPINNYMSSINRPGATGVLGGSGNLLVANIQASGHQSIDKQPDNVRLCFNISDLSGTNGVTLQQRWSIATQNPCTGGNAGSDLAFYNYNDAGTFINTPLAIKRSDGSMAIANISSMTAELGGTSKGQVFPIIPDNVEFGPSNAVFVVAGATSNQALYGTTFPVVFSTPVANLNPNYQSLVNINWANSLSTSSNHVNFKIGFSTATAYTNIVQTSYVPGLGGSWTPGDLPSATTPVGHTNICAVLDPDGLGAPGDGFLYVMAQLSDPSAPADQLYLQKGPSSEPTRNALCYKTI